MRLRIKELIDVVTIADEVVGERRGHVVRKREKRKEKNRKDC